ncbi:alpha/beta fold hydrolase [Agrococcus sp. Marseille-P2731]|uniref:alpha/beta fold hydrolase n=1 Tax=Agrococcus sp. Marseille-P2731 TaxID=1841862 RepID=UPI00093140BA|nr:alpha/beta hydrolase [Agrococcus sp. Marseille-P2731]
MRLSSTTAGAGPTHVGLVHGLGADGETWRPLIERMLAAGDLTVTTVDLRGHGSSARATSYALDDLADDVAETLPRGLSVLVGHSLGGPVVARAVERLAPSRAVYLDPGFGLALPTTGVAGRLFWTAPTITLGVAQLLRARRSGRQRAAYPQEVRQLLDDAMQRFDARMAVGVFRDVAFHPISVAPPAVPSTIVLSDESPAVLPNALATRLEQQGWDIRRIDGVGHDMHLEAPDRVLEAIIDVLSPRAEPHPD